MNTKIWNKIIGMFGLSLQSANTIYNIANATLVVGAVLVAVGTLTAIWTGGIRERYSDERISNNETETAQARATAAEANARAAEATLELAKFKAPRELLDEQQARIAGNMSRFRGQHVSIGAVPATSETVALAYQILNALKLANVNIHFNEEAAQSQVGIVRGVVVRYTTGNQKGREFAETLAGALREEKIVAEALDGLLEYVLGRMIAQGNATRNDAGREWVVIVVGDKPS
jgi:Tfp pilus assembly protein PilX